MDDEIDDADLAAALHASEHSMRTPQLATRTSLPSAVGPKIQQPKPVALPSRAGPSSIQVNTLQKGNPVLHHIHKVPWEYADFPADYVLGATTCALFLSLKYHRLHPEYIYTRIRALGSLKYNLRILLTLVDIDNHEDSLRELSKTSVINNLTLIMCKTAQEAGHYLEMYKTKEHADATLIRGQQATTFHERIEKFITTPRTINKTDANNLIANFPSLREAINAQPEDISMIPGFGLAKVDQWCQTVREPFRSKAVTRRGPTLSREGTRPGLSAESSVAEGSEAPPSARPTLQNVIPIGSVPSRALPRHSTVSARATPDTDRQQDDIDALFDEDDDALLAAAEVSQKSVRPGQAPAEPAPERPSQAPAAAKKPRKDDDTLNEGMMAALAKPRENG